MNTTQLCCITAQLITDNIHKDVLNKYLLKGNFADDSN